MYREEGAAQGLFATRVSRLVTEAHMKIAIGISRPALQSEAGGNIARVLVELMHAASVVGLAACGGSSDPVAPPEMKPDTSMLAGRGRGA